MSSFTTFFMEAFDKNKTLTIDYTNERIENNEKATILIVDDVLTNIHILAASLNKKYNLLIAQNGQKALNIVNQAYPDLILLDIHMPKMNGYEVCKILKKNSNTKDIPIIFVSAMTEVRDIVKGFEIGGVDYITKPFAKPLVLARVENQLRLKWHRDELITSKKQLQEKIKQMERMEKEQREQHRIAREKKTDQIKQEKKHQIERIHARKLATLGEMATGIAHELNQTLAGISYSTAFIKKATELHKLNDEDLLDSVKEINDSIKRISTIINHIRTFARQDAIEHESFDIHETIKGALLLMGEQLRLHNINVITNYDQNISSLMCSPSQLEQVWINHITNARDVLDEKSKETSEIQKTLTITTKHNETDKTITLTFSDNGIGMSEEVQRKAFDPFYTTKEVGERDRIRDVDKSWYYFKTQGNV